MATATSLVFIWCLRMSLCHPLLPVLERGRTVWETSSYVLFLDLLTILNKIPLWCYFSSLKGDYLACRNVYLVPDVHQDQPKVWLEYFRRIYWVYFFFFFQRSYSTFILCLRVCGPRFKTGCTSYLSPSWEQSCVDKEQGRPSVQVQLWERSMVKAAPPWCLLWGLWLRRTSESQFLPPLPLAREGTDVLLVPWRHEW